MGVAQVADADVDAGGLDGGQSDAGAEGVAGDRGADLGGEQEVVVPDAVGGDVFGDGVEPGLAEAEGAGLVVFRVGLDDVALAGGGVLLGDLDDRLLDGDRSAQEVDVSWFESDELTPAGPGLDYRGVQLQGVGVRWPFRGARYHLGAATRRNATGSVSSESPAATRKAVLNEDPAAIMPTSTAPMPVPASKPMFHTALATP